MEPLTKVQAQRVLEAAKSRPPWERLALRLLLEFELTAHEVCRLSVDDVRGNDVLVEDKRGQKRLVTLEEAARAELAAVLAERDSGALLGSSRPLGPDTVRRLLQSAARDVGVEGEVSIHRIRQPARLSA